MNGIGLHHIGFPTTDMASSIEFYLSLGGKLVFEKIDTDEGRPIEVKIIDFHGTLIECYERQASPKCDGAIDHLAFRVDDIDRMYALCKEKGYRFMAECETQVQSSSYWPKTLRWFIVYGANGEKVEFCKEV